MLLPRARRAPAAGLWPDRSLAGDQRQPAAAHQDRHGRPAAGGVEVRIAEDGEILVRGETVMKGYWNDPRRRRARSRTAGCTPATSASIDADGYLKITDRKKDFIMNSGGDMVSPARVEGFLTLQPEIDQAMVLRRPPPLSRRGHRAAPGIPRQLHARAAAAPATGWRSTWRCTRRSAPRSSASMPHIPAVRHDCSPGRAGGLQPSTKRQVGFAGEIHMCSHCPGASRQERSRETGCRRRPPH